jgi:hypothetical protein
MRPLLALLALALALVSVSALRADEKAPLKILRIGDSITRYAASDGRLARALEEAGIRHEMVGSQDWPSHGRPNLMEGYNGVPIQFFIARQKQFGQPATLNTDAVPLELALERFQPDLVLLMVGTNNLGSTDQPEINVPVLRGHLDKLLDRIHELAPAAHVIVATATPADNGYTRWPNMAHRNERTAAYNEQVVRPAVAARAAEGRSISLADAFSALDPATDLADGVHPNDSGKAKINATWFSAIQEWLATKS